MLLVQRRWRCGGWTTSKSILWDPQGQEAQRNVGWAQPANPGRSKSLDSTPPAVCSTSYLILAWLNIPDRWVMLFNANLDRASLHRKSKSELRKELRKWEDDKTKKKRNVVEDGATHEVAYDVAWEWHAKFIFPPRNFTKASLTNSWRLLEWRKSEAQHHPEDGIAPMFTKDHHRLRILKVRLWWTLRKSESSRLSKTRLRFFLGHWNILNVSHYFRPIHSPRMKRPGWFTGFKGINRRTPLFWDSLSTTV